MKEIDSDPFPGAADIIVGALGKVAGVPVTSTDSDPKPMMLTALILIVYRVPLVKFCEFGIITGDIVFVGFNPTKAPPLIEYS